MSAYIVDHKTVNRILTAIDSDTINHNNPTYGELGRLFGSLDDTGLETLGFALLSMNTEAVSTRYPNSLLDDLPGPINPPPYTFRHELCSMIQSYKSATCLRYQCSEGDVPETELYKKLDEACNVLAAAIVSSLPEYETADWG